MSDITKKIHSIEPETNLPEGRIKLKPLPEAPVERDVPDFVKRRNDLNPTLYKPSNTGQVFLWAGVLLALTWLVLGVALLFTRGIDVVQSWGVFEYLFVGVVIVLPALLILFLAITLKRLSQTSADALRLSDISAQLLKVDEHAAESVTSLAGAIRSSLNALDGDMVRLNTNLAHMKDESTIHATKLNEATDYALKSSETVAQNFAAQKESLSTAHHSLAETLTQLNTEFESKTTVISKLSEQTQTVTEKSAETVDAKLSLMSDKVKEIAAKDAEASENLAVFDEKASRTIQEMESKIQQLEAVTQKLNTENETFEKLLGKRSEELAQISKLNDVTDSTLKHLSGTKRKPMALKRK